MDNEFLLIALLAGGIALMVVSTKAEPEHDKALRVQQQKSEAAKAAVEQIQLEIASLKSQNIQRVLAAEHPGDAPVERGMMNKFMGLQSDIQEATQRYPGERETIRNLSREVSQLRHQVSQSRSQPRSRSPVSRKRSRQRSPSRMMSQPDFNKAKLTLLTPLTRLSRGRSPPRSPVDPRLPLSRSPSKEMEIETEGGGDNTVPDVEHEETNRHDTVEAVVSSDGRGAFDKAPPETKQDHDAREKKAVVAGAAEQDMIDLTGGERKVPEVAEPVQNEQVFPKKLAKPKAVRPAAPGGVKPKGKVGRKSAGQDKAAHQANKAEDLRPKQNEPFVQQTTEIADNLDSKEPKRGADEVEEVELASKVHEEKGILKEEIPVSMSPAATADFEQLIDAKRGEVLNKEAKVTLMRNIEKIRDIAYGHVGDRTSATRALFNKLIENLTKYFHDSDEAMAIINRWVFEYKNPSKRDVVGADHKPLAPLRDPVSGALVGTREEIDEEQANAKREREQKIKDRGRAARNDQMAKRRKAGNHGVFDEQEEGLRAKITAAYNVVQKQWSHKWKSKRRKVKNPKTFWAKRIAPYLKKGEGIDEAIRKASHDYFLMEVRGAADYMNLRAAGERAYNHFVEQASQQGMGYVNDFLEKHKRKLRKQGKGS